MHDFTNTHADFPETRMHGASEHAGIRDRLYWSAIYAFLRRKGSDRETARDITADFFADKVYGKDFFAKADPSKGPLRVFVMHAVDNYAVSWHRRPRNQPGGTNRSVEQDALDQFDRDQACAGSPDDAFRMALERETVNEALARCAQYFMTSGREGHWKVFEARLVRPTRGLAAPEPRDEAARAYGFENEAAASAAQQVVAKRFKMLLSEVRTEAGAD
jgi:hypothetical protein